MKKERNMDRDRGELWKQSEEDARQTRLRIEQIEKKNRLFQPKMFDPPLPGMRLAGIPLIRVPDSDVKYKSFLDWWFAVGKKAPNITTDDWASISGPYAGERMTDAIPKEDWEALPESERQAIEEWTQGIKVGVFFD